MSAVFDRYKKKYMDILLRVSRHEAWEQSMPVVIVAMVKSAMNVTYRTARADLDKLVEPALEIRGPKPSVVCLPMHRAAD
jgi:hypothetical protein